MNTPLTFLAAGLLLTLATIANAQLVPARTYFGVSRPIPLTVDKPADATGEMQIKLFTPDSKEVAAAAVVAGKVDLAALFPRLWSEASPSLLYAQLVIGEKQVGPPVVLQPLLTPNIAHLINPRTLDATLNTQTGRPMFEDDRIKETWQRRAQQTGTNQGVPPARPTINSGIRAYINKHIVFQTTEGDIQFRLNPAVAPNTAWNFRTLAEQGFYTDIIFHRVVPDFVIQVGDPTGQGTGGPGYLIDLEKSSLLHDLGVLSMARSGDPNSNGSQVFICLTRRATQALDGLYTAFGESVSGLDAINKIANTPLLDPRSGTPRNPPRIKQAILVDAPPISQEPPSLAELNHQKNNQPTGR